MSTSNWKSAASGDFDNATRWDTGHAPGASDVANISLAGSYTVTVDSTDTAGTLNFDAAGATLLETVAGSLTLNILKLSQGTVVLNNANTIGDYTFQTGGLLEFFDNGSLGTGTDYLTAGEQTAMANTTLGNYLDLYLGGAATTATIDAAAGTTLDIGSGGWTLNDAGSPTLQFGSASNTGTVVWHSTSGTVTGGGAYKVDVAGGTLKAGDPDLGILTTGATSTTVAAGGTLDLAGSFLEVHNLLGSGSVIDSGAATFLELDSATFSGAIGGALTLLVDGATTLSGANTYSGGTTLNSGKLVVTNSSSLGTGAISLAGGELLATANVTLSQNSTFSGTTTVAAATAKTLTLASGNMVWDGSSAPFNITFGDATHKGTVVLAPGTESENVTNPITVTVADGTLQLGNSIANSLTNNIATVTVAAGATLDTNGFLFDPNATVIAGTLTNSSTTAATFASYVGSMVSGAITGNLAVEVVNGTMTLTGTNTFTGTTTIDAGATLQLGNGGAGGTVAGSIVDNGLVRFDYSSPVTAGNAFSGSGNVEVATGTVVETNASIISGAVTIDSGATLQWGDGNSAFLVGGGNSVVDNGALVMNFGGGGIAGPIPISGSGQLIIQSGSLSESGVSTYTGNTTINSGASLLLSGTGSIANSSVVADKGTFDISGMTAGTSIANLTGSGLVSLGGQTLTIDNASGTFSGVLADGGLSGGTGGSLTIVGGTQTLTGTNTFTGTTTIDAGATLQLGNGGAGGTVAGSIVDNGLVRFDYSSPVTAGNAFSGSGNVEVATGTVVETNASIISGAVTIDSGATLQWGDGNSAFLVGGGNSVVDNGALVMNFGGGGIAGPIPISGSGQLIIQSGSLSESGVSTYTGNTTINSGASLLLSGTGSIANSSVVADKGTFDISGMTAGTSIANLTGSGLVSLGGQTLTIDNASGTFSGVLADGGLSGGTGGSLTIVGGTQTLTGTNTFTGTTTIDVGATLQLGNGGAGGTILAGSAIVDNGSLVDDHSSAKTLGGIMSGAGSFTKNGPGATTLSGANTYSGGTTLNAGELIVTNGASLGSGAISLAGGELLATANVTLSQDSTFTGTTTVAAATAKTLTLASNRMTWDDSSTPVSITFGDAAHKGTVVLAPATGAPILGHPVTVTVADGTLQLGSDAAGDLFSGVTTVTIAAGATLDIDGFDFGSNAAIVDNGSLVDDHSSAETLSGIISGTGSFTKNGPGATTLSGANTYSGGTTLNAGELIVTNAKSLGSGTLTLTGGELLSTANMVQTHVLHTGGTDTIAAAHGTALVFAATSVIMDAGKLVVGDSAGNDGTLVFKDSGALTLNDAAHTTVEVRAGTLAAAADNALSTLLKSIAGTTIDNGAILDASGHALNITALTGSGTLTNSSSTSEVTSLYGATNFTGAITGETNVDVFGNAALTGNETFTGALTIEGAFTVRLQGLFAETVKFAGASGTVVLATPANFTGAIEGFQAGTTVDLRNIKSTGDTLTYNTTTHILTVSDGTHSDQLHFSGSYVQGNFLTKDDGTGHADIIWQTDPMSPEATAVPQPGASSTHDNGLTDIGTIDFNQNIYHAGDWIG